MEPSPPVSEPLSNQLKWPLVEVTTTLMSGSRTVLQTIGARLVVHWISYWKLAGPCHWSRKPFVPPILVWVMEVMVMAGGGGGGGAGR